MSSIIVGERNSGDEGPLRPISGVELDGHRRLDEQMVVERPLPGEGKCNNYRSQQCDGDQRQLGPLALVADNSDGASPGRCEQKKERSDRDEEVSRPHVGGPPGKQKDEATDRRESDQQKSWRG